MQQLPFPFLPEETMAISDYLVTSINQEAYHYLWNWPEWGDQPYHAICWLSGKSGAGKTHCCRAWQQWLAPQHFVHYYALRTDAAPPVSSILPHHIYILDDIDHAPLDAEYLLHLINWVRESRAWLLLTASQPAGHIATHLPDLASRLKALPAQRIHEPDDDFLMLLLSKLLSDRQLRATPEILAYMVRRMERSCQAAIALVSAIDAHTLSYQRNITIPLMREIFETTPIHQPQETLAIL